MKNKALWIKIGLFLFLGVFLFLVIVMAQNGIFFGNDDLADVAHPSFEETSINAANESQVYWDTKEVSGDDGYILVGTFDTGWYLLHRNGTLIRKLPGWYSRFFEGGDVATLIFDGQAHLARVRGFQALWKVSSEVSHDLQISSSDESIWYIFVDYTQRRQGKVLKAEGIEAVDKDGKKIFNWNFLDHSKEITRLSGTKFKLFTADHGLNKTPEDIFYTLFNGLEIIPPNGLENTHPEFKAGNIMVSDRMHSLIFIIDPKSKKVVWAYESKSEHGGVHSPKWLKSDRILFFANTMRQADDRLRSEVHELDPLSKEIVWKYTEPPLGQMLCDRFGSVQRLDNGNTLISYGCENSSVLEINPAGKTVWKWQYFEEQIGSDGVKRPIQIFRADWIPKKVGDNWLNSQ